MLKLAKIMLDLLPEWRPVDDPPPKRKTVGSSVVLASVSVSQARITLFSEVATCRLQQIFTRTYSTKA